jgi:hypothetical protein
MPEIVSLRRQVIFSNYMLFIDYLKFTSVGMLLSYKSARGGTTRNDGDSLPLGGRP